MLNWLGAGVKVNSGAQWYSLCKLQMVKWFPQYLFFFNIIFCPFFFFFLFCFFFKFCLLNSANLQREGPYAGIDGLSFFFTSSTTIFFNSTMLIKLEPSACSIFFFFLFCFDKTKFHIVILFSLYKLRYHIRHLCLRLKYFLPSPLARATRIRGRGHGWYVPFPQWCRLVVQALYVYEPTRTRELWHVWLASTLRKVIKSLLEIIIAKSQDEAAGQTTRHRIQIIV